MSPHYRNQLIQQIVQLETDIAHNSQAIQGFERLLFKYSQLTNLQVGSLLIVEMTERIVAERKQHEANVTQYEELLGNLGQL